jgi:hypothetical protein
VATRRVTATPVIAGLLAGEAAVVVLVATGRDPFLGMNAGFVALALNVAVTLAAWAVVRRQVSTKSTDPTQLRTP